MRCWDGIGKTYAYLAAATAASAFPDRADHPPHHHFHFQYRAAKRGADGVSAAAVLRPNGGRILTKPLKAVIRKGKSHYVCDERLDRRLRQV